MSNTSVGTNLNFNLNELQLAVLQPLAANPTVPTPVVGQMYYNTLTKRIRTFNGSTWDEAGTSAATGDVIGPSSALDDQIVLYSGTTGKIIKVSTLSVNVLKITNGILEPAIPDLDYIEPTGDGSQLTGLTASQVGAPAGSGTSTGTNTGDNAPNSLYSNLVNGLEQFANFAAFPVTGHPKTVYLALDTRFPYFWNTATSSYKKIGSFTSNKTVSLSGVKTFGRYATGDTIPSIDLLPSEVINMAIVEPIAPTLTLTSSTTIPFNTTSISNVLNFSYVINSLGASVATCSLEWRRNNTGSWTVLSSSTVITTFTHNTTDSAFNAQPFNYRYIVTDSVGGTATATLNITPIAYVNPSISFSVGTTLRELGDVTTNITGTITRNSSLVLLANYQLQQSINGGAFSNVGSPIVVTGATPSINVTDSNGSLINSTSIAYRIVVTDGFTTTTSSSTTINFTHKSTLGYNTATSLTLAQILAQGNAAFTNSKVRTITGVTAPASNYTYYCYASSAGDLTSVIQDGAAPVLGAFTKLTDVTGTNTFGANVSYRVYKSNAPQAFTSNSLAFS